MIDANETQNLAFFRRPRSAEYLGAANLGDLDCRHADPAGCAMNEDTLAALQASKVDQRVVGGEKSGGDRCRSLEAQLLRNAGNRGACGGHEAGETGRRKSEHPIANGKTLDIRTETDDFARAFHADGSTREAVLQCLFGEHSHDPHHVTEIDAGGVNANLNLPGRRRFALRRGDEQIVQRSVGGELELEGFRCRSPLSVRAQTMVSEPCLLGNGGRTQPIDVALGRGEQNLAFGFSPDQLAG
ncbi:MAG TPA: hypothetical protein VIH63_00560 [Xanthobacteraceae bacterium]